MKFGLLLATIGILYSCSPRLENLGDNYYLEYNSMNDLMIVKPVNFTESKVILYGHISQYAVDENFILVSEQPRHRIIEGDTTFFNGTHDLLLKSKFKQYFIIDKKHDSVFGPYTKESFIISRKRLGISDKLIF